MTEREFIASNIVVFKRRRGRRKYTVLKHPPTGIAVKKTGWITDPEIEAAKEDLINKVLSVFDVIETDSPQGWKLRRKNGN